MKFRKTGHAMSVLALVGWAALVVGCADAKRIEGCDPADGVTPLCGLTNPEDLVVTPDGRWIITGEMPHPGTESPIQGRLVAVRVADEGQEVLFPGDAPSPKAASALGDTACPGPPDPARFGPHGLDVNVLSSGRVVLAVVNHGAQERVDFFDVKAGSDVPELAWAGCVVVPADMWPNDVVLREDGSLVVSKMLPGPLDSTGISVGLRLLTGGDTGAVYTWNAETGWREIPNSQGSAPNGVAVSAEGGDLFFAEWGGDGLVRLQGFEGEAPVRESVELPHHPDNLSWTPDGQLLAAGQVGSWPQMMACQSLEEGTCALAFSVVRVDPETLEVEEILVHPGTAMGSVSAALVVGDRLYLGSFASDRMASAPYTP